MTYFGAIRRSYANEAWFQADAFGNERVSTTGQRLDSEFLYDNTAFLFPRDLLFRRIILLPSLLITARLYQPVRPRSPM